MSGVLVEVETAAWRFVADVTSRARSDLHGLRLPERMVPAVVVSVNLASEPERAKVLASLPDADRAEADSALRALAAKVTAARAKLAPPAAAPLIEGPTLAPWPVAVNGADLLTDLKGEVARYVVLDDAAITAIALWTIHTFVADVAAHTPYLLVTSPTRQCGKTVLLEVLEQLVFAPEKSDGFTSAALYRTIDKKAPHITILFDELDARLRGDSGEALRGVLNSGFSRSGKVTICVGDEHDARHFKTFVRRCWRVSGGRGTP